MRTYPIVVFVVLGLVALGCQRKSGAPPADTSAGKVVARPGMLPVPGPSLPRGPWRWIATVTPAGRIACPNPELYSLEFLPDSTVRAAVDCNRGSGHYHVAGRSLRIGPVATTRMVCLPGTKGEEFGKEIDGVRTWFTSGDTLMLDLTADSGTMRFVHGSTP